MKSTYQYYEAEMAYCDETIRLMFKTEYYTYEKTKLLLRYAVAAALVAAALLGGLPIAGQAVCLMIGAWLFVAPDFPSKIRAEGVIQQRGGQTSIVRMRFDGTCIEIGNGLRIAYEDVDHLIEDRQYFYIFRDKQTAVMVPKDGIVPDNAAGFQAYIEEKTGKQFVVNKSFAQMNLRDVLTMLRDEMAQKKARRRH